MTIVINLPWLGRRQRRADSPDRRTTYVLRERAFAVPYASLRRTLRRP
jgi:hypothetical protein